MKLRHANLQVYEETSFTHPPSRILPSFPQNASQLLSKEALKVCEHISFREYKWKVVLLVIYLFNDDLSKSTFLMLNMAFNVLFRTVFVK